MMGATQFQMYERQAMCATQPAAIMRKPMMT